MNKPRTLREQKRKCRHFNGTMNDACEVGVKYADVRNPNPAGPFQNLPCFLEMAEPQKACAKCSPKTEAEIDAEIAESERRFADTMQARAAIVAACGGPWKKGMAGSIGVIDCPVCSRQKGLHYSRAGSNGHVHARCESDGCVSWME